MSRWHDIEAPVCTCFDCTEARYHAAVAEKEAQLEREEAELAARAQHDLQLRLPMSPLPHVAHHPGRLQRAASVPCQPEMI